MVAPQIRILQDDALDSLVSLLQCSSIPRILPRILQRPVDVSLSPLPLPLPQQIPQDVVKDDARTSSFNGRKHRLRHLLQSSTGSRPGNHLRVIRVRLLALAKGLHGLKGRSKNLGGAYSRVKEAADSVEPRDFQFRFPFTLSRLQRLANRISNRQALRMLLDLPRDDIFQPPVLPGFQGSGRMCPPSTPSSASTWAPTPPSVTLRLPLQRASASRVFEKDSASTGFEPPPQL